MWNLLHKDLAGLFLEVKFGLVFIKWYMYIKEAFSNTHSSMQPHRDFSRKTRAPPTGVNACLLWTTQRFLHVNNLIAMVTTMPRIFLHKTDNIKYFKIGNLSIFVPLSASFSSFDWFPAIKLLPLICIQMPVTKTGQVITMISKPTWWLPEIMYSVQV